jgi:tRNA pseudouridine38-40 synthase
LTSSQLSPSGQDSKPGERVALIVEYDGSSFHGWQLQRGSEVGSVQAVLEAAVSKVANSPVRLHCAGRTDTGVHATNQVVHFDSPCSRSTRSWVLGSNGNLPDCVCVKQALVVDPSFHARFSALSRRYRYLLYNADVRSAIGPAYLTWVRQPLDVELMHCEAQALLGERDFSSFRAAACQSSTPMRRVDSIEVYRRGPLVIVDIQANAFLHHMVRNIVGSLLQVGKGRCQPGWLDELLGLRDRTRAADTAPANGLYLVQVQYPQEYGLPMRQPGPVFVEAFDSQP